jgi:hypothetical protein
MILNAFLTGSVPLRVLADWYEDQGSGEISAWLRSIILVQEQLKWWHIEVGKYRKVMCIGPTWIRHRTLCGIDKLMRQEVSKRLSDCEDTVYDS